MALQNHLLKPDADGYYTVELSRLGRPDLSGRTRLPLTDTQVATLNTRPLRGEAGHPKPDFTIPADLWVQRCLDISENHVSHLLKDITVQTVPDEEGLDGKVQLITAKMKPSGPASKFLQHKLDCSQPVYFGMRSMVNERVGEPSVITHVITWDFIGTNPYPVPSGLPPAPHSQGLVGVYDDSGHPLKE